MEELTDHEFAVEMTILWSGISPRKRGTLMKLIQGYFDSPTEIDNQTRADRIIAKMQIRSLQQGL